MKHHYIDNKEFLKSLIEYKELVNSAKKEERPIPRMPEFLGKCFLDISENMAKRPEFNNYSYKQEMISDGYLICIKYWNSFDSNIHDNPFGYFSRSIYRAFIARINKEKREQYSRYKLTFHSGILNSGNLTDSDGNAIAEVDSLADNMHDFVKNYEDKMQEKKDLKAANKDITKKKVPK